MTKFARQSDDWFKLNNAISKLQYPQMTGEDLLVVLEELLENMVLI